MGNFIFAGFNLIDADTIQNPTAGTSDVVINGSLDSGFTADNILSLTRLKKRIRKDDADTNAAFFYVDFGAARAVTAIVLDDVNFDTVKIQGDAATTFNSDAGNPQFPGSNVTISRDSRVQRYKVYIPLVGFNYRYLRVFIPAGTTAVGTYTTKWELGRIACLVSPYTMVTNPAEYMCTAKKARRIIQLDDGPSCIVELSGSMRWEGFLSLNYESSTTDFTTLNALDSSQPIVFYENISTTKEDVYICYKENDIEIYRKQNYGPNVVSANTLHLVEFL